MAGAVRQFHEAHSFLQNISGEIEVLKMDVLQDNEQRKAEIAEARSKLEQERCERREQIRRLRTEFEDFVSRKVDRVLEEIEEMKMIEQKDDSSQQQMLQHLVGDMQALQEDLRSINASWRKLAEGCAVNAPGEG
mmetsp:Transcript_102094/g.264386  ORF Transcript_102094/g.264386 Transcript_102094/m.264386 type:complete len:135 (-) Transcript_102094:212-616(-)